MATSRNQNPTNEELRKELHKLIAQHESTRPKRRVLPEDRYPIYFQNFIYKRPINFYCNLCDKNLTISAIMEHVNSPNHMKDVIDARRNQNLSEDSAITPSIRKLLVENNIFRHGSSLKCLSCELIIESPYDVEDHIMSLDHKRESNDFETLTYPGITSKNAEIISKNDPPSMLIQTPLSDLNDNFFIYFNNFIGKHNDIYVCHVCEVKLMSMYAARSHINKNNHKISLAKRIPGHEVSVENKIDRYRYKLLVENGIFKFGSYYWCSACKSVLDLFITSNNHLHRLSHLKSLKLFIDSCPKETKESPVKKNQEIIVQKYPNSIEVDSQDDDEKMLTCFICPATQLWRKHKNTDEHQLRKYFYVLHFKESPGDLVSCIVCKATLHKSLVIDHASKEHKSLPWYRRPDEFIVYFKNFIQPIGKRYFCHLCQVMTSYWYLAMMHVIKINHSRCVEGSVVEIDSIQSPLTPDFCKKMITNGIFPYNVRQLKCWTCDSIIKSYNHVQLHILSDGHEYELQVKQFKINTQFL